MDKCPHCGKSLTEQPELELTGGKGRVEVAFLPLANGQEYPVYDGVVMEFQHAFPAVDIIAEVRKMRTWFIANPTRRKTSRGIVRFMNSWLTKAQDQPRNGQHGRTGNFGFAAEREQIARVTGRRS